MKKYYKRLNKAYQIDLSDFATFISFRVDESHHYYLDTGYSSKKSFKRL
jgi:hypothetical protein